MFAFRMYSSSSGPRSTREGEKPRRMVTTSRSYQLRRSSNKYVFENHLIQVTIVIVMLCFQYVPYFINWSHKPASRWSSDGQILSRPLSKWVTFIWNWSGTSSLGVCIDTCLACRKYYLPVSIYSTAGIKNPSLGHLSYSQIGQFHSAGHDTRRLLRHAMGTRWHFVHFSWRQFTTRITNSARQRVSVLSACSIWRNRAGNRRRSWYSNVQWHFSSPNVDEKHQFCACPVRLDIQRG